MINHFNFKKFRDKVLVTNDLGRYLFVDEAELRTIVREEVTGDSELGRTLESRGFCSFSSEARYLERFEGWMREGKGYTFSPTSLHIFVVSTACNLACRYCQAGCESGARPELMDIPTAKKAVDVALQSPARYLSFEFQGGEPLTNFPVIRFIVEYAEEHRGSKEIRFSLVSNLSLLSDEVLDFLASHDVGVSTSLDGHEYLHNANRPFRNGSGSFQGVCKAVSRLREAGIEVGAIQTTTKKSLPFAKEIVETYEAHGFDNVFVRPLTPLGVARENWDSIGYSATEFKLFYKRVLDEIIEVNKRGGHMREGHASLFLAKAIHGNPANYMELRSPCGAAVGQIAYCPGGEVFTCDEGRMLHTMGDDSFRLGNVFENQYGDLIAHPACRATCLASVTESIPGCCDCVYQPYCGVCPVVTLALEGDLLPKSPHGYRCEVYKGMLEAVFDLLYENDGETMKILEEWHV